MLFLYRRPDLDLCCTLHRLKNPFSVVKDKRVKKNNRQLHILEYLDIFSQHFLEKQWAWGSLQLPGYSAALDLSLPYNPDKPSAVCNRQLRVCCSLVKLSLSLFSPIGCSCNIGSSFIIFLLWVHVVWKRLKNIYWFGIKVKWTIPIAFCWSCFSTICFSQWSAGTLFGFLYTTLYTFTLARHVLFSLLRVDIRWDLLFGFIAVIIFAYLWAECMTQGTCLSDRRGIPGGGGKPERHWCIYFGCSSGGNGCSLLRTFSRNLLFWTH